jgi:hypothetical protein
MNKHISRRIDCFQRVYLYGELPDLVFTPTETALFTKVKETWTTMKAMLVEQVEGHLEFDDAVKDRRMHAAAALVKLGSVRDVARSLELAGTIGITYEAFRLPRSRSYATISAAASAFAEAAEPQKAKFIERGLAATFVEDLEAIPAQLDTASGDRVGGRLDYTGGTAGLEALAKAGLKLVQQLRPMIRLKVANDPSKLGAWNLAARVESSRDAAAAATPPPDGGTGGSTPPSGS